MILKIIRFSNNRLYFQVQSCISNNRLYFQVQKLQEAAEIVKSRCEKLLHKNNQITKTKHKNIEKVCLEFQIKYKIYKNFIYISFTL